MVSNWQIALMIGFLVFATYSLAEEPALDLRLRTDAMPQFRISEERLGGFERKRVGDVRIRGWNVGQNLHFGQAKVADKWGLGFIYQRREVTWGVNHRGIQVTRSL